MSDYEIAEVEASSRNNVENTRGRPWPKGNPGRPKGSRNKATLAIQNMLEGDLEAITRTVVERARQGDMAAIKLIFDRFPARRDDPIWLDLPSIETARDIATASESVMKSMATGKISPSQAALCMDLLSTHSKFVEMLDRGKELEIPEPKTAKHMTSEERAQRLAELVSEIINIPRLRRLKPIRFAPIGQTTKRWNARLPSARSSSRIFQDVEKPLRQWMTCLTSG